ncbi:MAG: class I SAM-dependent methyltransferase [Sulfurimonas sp.]|nr:class I SAM-dependent methyltransferase [Sulfurimonas sp.]MDQ7060141.1 class I SAM-dependent methyltransferase [Sulfurimonas sp.]
MPRIDSKKFYLSAIDKHGLSPQGVNWISQETQDLRFKILLELLPTNINTLVDAGCGFADFYMYLQNTQHCIKKYIGIDSLAAMCTIAVQETSQEIIQADITKDALPQADYYVCSGAMNILNPFEAHLFIRNCFKASSKAFIFNTLYGDKQSNTYNYMSMAQIQAIAKDLHVKRLEIKDNYMKNDITVAFFHV